ncbi:hypothetical protein PUN28_007370 [Cardiocondyla obscurior]|uniref:Uncharacterized protein n=1 Tax=Cardiocondyla obscurior TaxID=286306 RepID=A0AAW2G512_9HYME
MSDAAYFSAFSEPPLETYARPPADIDRILIICRGKLIIIIFKRQRFAKTNDSFNYITTLQSGLARISICVSMENCIHRSIGKPRFSIISIYRFG